MKVMKQVEVAIIGAGSAGLHALSQVRKRTDDFVIINEGPYGTTCARVGCMPSKALIEAADVLHLNSLYDEMGFHLNGDVTVDGPAVMKRVRRLRDRFTAGTVRSSTGNLDEGRNIPGRVKILAPDLIKVNGELIKTQRLIIASGSKAFVPPAWLELGDGVLTSDTVFEMEDLPKSMAVVGLGAIGLELAQAFSRLGVKVVGFDMLEMVGGITDPEVSAEAVEITGNDFPLHLGVRIDLARGDSGDIVVRWGGDSVRVEKALVAAGRKPNIDGLGLENLGVELDPSGLPEFDHQTLQVGDLPVYITGDVNGRAPILHEAADDGLVAGYNAMRGLDEQVRFKRRAPLGIVFSDPNIAFAGARFSELDMGDVVLAGDKFTGQGRAITAGSNRGILRMYASRSSGRVLGAEMIAPSGEHLAHLIAWAVQMGLTVTEMLELPYYHPVVEEAVRGVLRKLSRQIVEWVPAPEIPPMT